MALADGRPVHVGFDTRFTINWPEQLGGGSVNLDLVGGMVLVPLLGT